MQSSQQNNQPGGEDHPLLPRLPQEARRAHQRDGQVHRGQEHPQQLPHLADNQELRHGSIQEVQGCGPGPPKGPPRDRGKVLYSQIYVGNWFIN